MIWICEQCNHFEWEKATPCRWCHATAADVDLPLYRVSAGDLRTDAIESRQLRESADGKRYASMPMFILNNDGSQGRIKRQCTKEYKVEPVERCVRRDILGLAPGEVAPQNAVHHWFGISIDEKRRMRQSRNRWSTNIYPLCTWPDRYIPRPMTRTDCEEWFEANYPGRPLPESSCLACPFRDDVSWLKMKTEQPGEFADAVAFDYAMREADKTGQAERFGGRQLVGLPYVHRAMVPLDQVDFAARVAERRANGGNPGLFDADEEGSCGVCEI